MKNSEQSIATTYPSESLTAATRSTDPDSLSDYPDILRAVGEANQTLAQSLLIFDGLGEHEPTAEQQQLVKAVVTADAHDLVANILPQEVVAQLGAEAKRRDDIGFEHPPILSDLFLLIRAYDATQDPVLQQSLEYILDQALPNPELSLILVESYQRSLRHDTPIMTEYRKLDTIIDAELTTAHTRLVAQTDEDNLVVMDENQIVGLPQTDRITDPFVTASLSDYLQAERRKPPVGGKRY
ncbi:MAG: hypothetical protein ACHQTE_01895 [Candidatus Saccharimonadales bacterium]